MYKPATTEMVAYTIPLRICEFRLLIISVCLIFIQKSTKQSIYSYYIEVK